MKKYISIFSLLSVFLIISCERSSDLEDEIQETKITNSAKIFNNDWAAAENESSESNSSELDNLDTGDDDEPRRDKQHWRVVSDSAR